MTPTPKKTQQSPGQELDKTEKSEKVEQDVEPPPKRTRTKVTPSASSAEPKTKPGRVKKTDKVTKAETTKADEANKSNAKKIKKKDDKKTGGGPAAETKSEVELGPPRIKDPALNYTKTFARRRRPNTDAGALKWETLRTVFIDRIKPCLSTFSVHEDWGGRG